MKIALACYENEVSSPVVNDVFLIVEKDVDFNIQEFVYASENYEAGAFRPSAKLLVLAAYALERGYKTSYTTHLEDLEACEAYLHISPSQVLVWKTNGSGRIEDWTLAFRSRERV